MGAAFNARRRKEHREKLNQIKVERGCVDCGFNKHPAALCFDHEEPTKKKFTIARMTLYSWEKILEEIAKCVVRCANCHSIKTSEKGEASFRRK